MKVGELKAALDKAGVEYPDDAKKPDLEKLYQEHVDQDGEDEEVETETSQPKGTVKVEVVRKSGLTEKGERYDKGDTLYITKERKAALGPFVK